MLKIFKHLKWQEWAQICVCLIFIVGQVWLDLELPKYMGEITTLVKTEGSKISEIWVQGGWMLLCALGSLVSAVIVGFIVARLGSVMAKRLRSLMFSKVSDFGVAEINKFSTSSLITRSTNDVTQVQMFITMGLQLLIKSPILAVWAVIKISGKGFEWSLATGIAVVILLSLFTFLLLMVFPKFKKMQALTDSVSNVTRENLIGLPVVRAYNAEEFEEAKFEKANNNLTKTQLFTSRSMAFMMPMVTFVLSGLSLAIYVIGALLINSAPTLTVAEALAGEGERIVLFSDMMIFSSYAMQVIMAFMMIAMMFIFLPRASTSSKRINEVLNTKSSITDGFITEGEQEKKGEVVFKNVSFKYPGAADYVLKDINFTAKSGETVAFIGSTGSGKSTLINLIPRFFDATEGAVLVGGVNVKDYKLEALNNKIGYIPQKAVLFSGTVSSNIAFGDNGKVLPLEEGVKSAVEIAQGKSFVEKMEKGYDSEISRGGTNISGGQKQRLSIARAICRNPEIFIFDDSFSALDYKTDRKLRTALKKETAEATKLIVAQRVGTIMDADKIIVLDEGEIVGIGTHSQLLKNCKVYKEIARSQLSKEELKI